ncbi:hydrogenase maturation protease [Actinomycetes bacterium KLBMP 9797]
MAVIGVGNMYRRDDGLGHTVAVLLTGRVPGVAVMESDGEAVRLMEAWAGARVAVVVDALRVHGGTPGRIHRLDAAGLASEQRRAANAHAVRLGDVVELARVLDCLPERLVVFAVEVTDTGYGVGLSAPVADAAATVADAITRLLSHP